MIRNLKRILLKLQSEDPSVRRLAAERLSEADERAIYPLIQALKDRHPGVQDAAMRSLVSIGGEVTAYMTIPLLREASSLRNMAFVILGELGVHAVPLLYPLLRDKNDDIRKFAVDLLRKAGRGVDPSRIIPSLRDPNQNVRAAAAGALGELGCREAVPFLIDALADEEWTVISALESLGELKAEEATDAVASLLFSGSEAIRHVAVETLGCFSAEKAAQALLSHVERASGDERTATIRSLITAGVTPQLRGLSEHLITILREGDWDEKLLAIRGIAGLRCKAAVSTIVDLAGSLDPSLPENAERIALFADTLRSLEAGDELITLLDDPGLRYRGKSLAVYTLGYLKRDDAVPKIIPLLRHISRDLRRASVDALGNIGGEVAMAALIEAAEKDHDAHVRRAAIEALGKNKVTGAYHFLLGRLNIESYTDLTEAIVRSLMNIDRKTFLTGVSGQRDAVRLAVARISEDEETLLGLAVDENRQVRITAISRLGHTPSGAVVRRLTELLGDDDPETRKMAVMSIGNASLCPPELLRALTDEDGWVRFQALHVVSSTCNAETVLKHITPLVGDPFVPVCLAAVDAIGRLGRQAAEKSLASYEHHPEPAVRRAVRKVLAPA